MDKFFCASCGIENKNPEFKCMHCGGEEMNVTKTRPPIPITDKGIEAFVVDSISAADGYIKSPFRCFFCNDSHYMIWPGKRDPNDYEKVKRLTVLPQCPKRVWQYGKHDGIGMPLNKLLGELEAK